MKNSDCYEVLTRVYIDIPDSTAFQINMNCTWPKYCLRDNVPSHYILREHTVLHNDCQMKWTGATRSLFYNNLCSRIKEIHNAMPFISNRGGLWGINFNKRVSKETGRRALEWRLQLWNEWQRTSSKWFRVHWKSWNNPSLCQWAALQKAQGLQWCNIGVIVIVQPWRTVLREVREKLKKHYMKASICHCQLIVELPW